MTTTDDRRPGDTDTVLDIPKVTGAGTEIPKARRATSPMPPPTAPSAAPQQAPPPDRRWSSSRADRYLAVGLTVLVLAVLARNITGFPTATDDEGTYLAQAWAVQQGRGLAHYTYWYDHPPLGWIQIALLSRLPSALSPGSMTVATMRLVMLGISGASAVLVYVLGRRLSLPRWAAGLGMALFGLSPLAVVLSREIFLDNIAVMWLLLAFCLAASPSRHLWHHFGAGLAAAAGVLTKETMLVVLP